MSRLSISSLRSAPIFWRGRGAFLPALAAILLVRLAAPAILRAQDDTAGAISREVKSVFERCGKAVVKIHAVDEHSELSGTGFFVDPTGTIYTSYSVGGDADNFTVQFDGKKYHATQLMADVRSGIALLKVDAATPFLPIGKSSSVGLATPVVAIGYPLDLPESPSFGMVAGFDRKYLGRYFSTTHVRVNLPTQRGEAGAPLLNFKGEVVGILISSVDSGSACYALPIDAAEKIRRDYIRFGDARHGWIGIDVQVADKSVEGSDAQMTQIRKDAPAADSGLEAGDMLLQVGNVPVHQPEDVIDASFFISAGDSVPITVMRGDQKMTFTVQAGAVVARPLVPAEGPNASEVMALGPTKKTVVPLRLDSDKTP
ncbi:MAG: trypsin-like peptidase domain-containing protein [Chthoniobacterales bacterium]|nr:trypsin-like peptidase domain-containing protein [Chthoniobacterales bacterium]